MWISGESHGSQAQNIAGERILELSFRIESMIKLTSDLLLGYCLIHAAVSMCRAAIERMSLEVARSFLVEADAYDSIEAITLRVHEEGQAHR